MAIRAARAILLDASLRGKHDESTIHALHNSFFSGFVRTLLEMKNIYQTPEYRAWSAMKNRCYNAKNPKYALYGGRGIKVCSEWIRSFSQFLNDIGLRPSPKHSLDRINNDGNYEPTNCRWATTYEQSINRRDTVNITIDGKTKPLCEWCEIFQMPREIVAYRLRRGYEPEFALTNRYIRHLVPMGFQTGNVPWNKHK